MTDDHLTPEDRKLWLWQNFVDGEPQYLAFDNPCPTYDGGDPMTLGEPVGYAIVKNSTPGWAEWNDAEVAAKIKRAVSVNDAFPLAVALAQAKDQLAAAEADADRLAEALGEVNERLADGEGPWWLTEPDRGGFDHDKINEALAAHAARKIDG